ncbi:hypothetical protein WR25_12900 [Diploscapter pachys]|uniref:Uncharacterized protein n=1 Tax=Diploscapter pachys TaxID=2018661 RepID=A0A2A2LFU9_9BILA|nr:hypothetical protein WR25_12900 [Diploscapter pachys]
MVKSCLLMVELTRRQICQVGVAHRSDHLLICRITSNDKNVTPNQQIVVVEDKLVPITLSIPAHCMKLFNIALTRPTDECKRKTKMEEEEKKQKEKE